MYLSVVVEVVRECWETRIAAVPVRNQEYTVGDDTLEYYMNWAESVGHCGGLIYTLSMGDGSNL